MSDEQNRDIDDEKWEHWSLLPKTPPKNSKDKWEALRSMSINGIIKRKNKKKVGTEVPWKTSFFITERSVLASEELCICMLPPKWLMKNVSRFTWKTWKTNTHFYILNILINMVPLPFEDVDVSNNKKKYLCSKICVCLL